MAQGGETPVFEASPQMPESSAEVPVMGAVFEAAGAPIEERPAAPAPAPAPAAPAPATQPQKDQAMMDVERVMEEGMAEAYKKMNPGLQRKFVKEGDAAARSIAVMVRNAKIRAREVLALITRWLKIIPGVNRFFLEQEAKLKTDKILALGKRGKQP